MGGIKHFSGAYLDATHSVIMAESGLRMQPVLEGHAKLLKEKDLALPKHQPYLVRWVPEFLLFAQSKRKGRFGGRMGTKWVEHVLMPGTVSDMRSVVKPSKSASNEQGPPRFVGEP